MLAALGLAIYLVVEEEEVVVVEEEVGTAEVEEEEPLIMQLPLAGKNQKR